MTSQQSCVLQLSSCSTLNYTILSVCILKALLFVLRREIGSRIDTGIEVFSRAWKKYRFAFFLPFHLRVLFTAEHPRDFRSRRNLLVEKCIRSIRLAHVIIVRRGIIVRSLYSRRVLKMSIRAHHRLLRFVRTAVTQNFRRNRGIVLT